MCALARGAPLARSMARQPARIKPGQDRISRAQSPQGTERERDAAVTVPHPRRAPPGMRRCRPAAQPMDYFPLGLTGKLRDNQPFRRFWPVRSAVGRAMAASPRTRRAPSGVRGRRTGCLRMQRARRSRERPAVSETLARTSADGSQGGAPAAQRGRRPAWLTPVNVVIIIATLVGFALRLHFQAARPGFLLGVTEYDDGPYFGSAVRLVHGSMPYRQFVLVQPPGITLLMSPAALLSYWTGTAWGLAIGRILTLLAGTAGVALAGLLVRHRGLLAVLVTCGIMAVYSDAVAAAHTVLVEPWLVLFCLAGAVAVFDRDRITASTKRLAWGGVLFGFAGAIEAWAIVPVLVLAALCLPQLNRAAIYAGGVAAGFLIPVLPFALAGPRQFYHSLITAQVGYRAHAVRVAFLSRLRDMIGFPYAIGWPRTAVLLAVLALVVFVIVAQAGAVAVTHRPPPTLDWFAMASAVLIVAMFLWPPQFHYHFAQFLAPFLALSLALPVARLLSGAEPGEGVAVSWPRTSGPQAARRLGMGIVSVTAAALAVVAVFQFRSATEFSPV